MRRVLIAAFAFTVALLGTQSASAKGSWACKADEASGFSKNDKGDWQAARFTSEREFVLSPATAEDIAKVVELVDTQGASLPFGTMPIYVVKEGEEELPIASCPMELKSGAQLMCKGPWGWTTLYFSAKTDRYLYVSPAGVWDVEDGDTEHPWANKSPFTEIGTCKEF